jgi:hypothetical protein
MHEPGYLSKPETTQNTFTTSTQYQQRIHVGKWGQTILRGNLSNHYDYSRENTNLPLPRTTIGIDFISAFELHLCLKHNHFHFQNRCPIKNNHIISTVKETFFPANCSSLVQINVSSEETRQPNICLLAEVQVPTRPWIQGAPSIVQTDQHGRSFLEIHNASPTPRQLQANEILGIDQPVDPIQLFPLSDTTAHPTDINVIKEKVITEED